MFSGKVNHSNHSSSTIICVKDDTLQMVQVLVNIKHTYLVYWTAVRSADKRSQAPLNEPSWYASAKLWRIVAIQTQFRVLFWDIFTWLTFVQTRSSSSSTTVHLIAVNTSVFITRPAKHNASKSAHKTRGACLFAFVGKCIIIGRK